MRIVDFHTHAFPDAIAQKAMPVLEAEAGIRAVLDGTISSLLRSMDEAGIEKAVVASIATKPSQFPAILNWSKAIASERLIPFPSVHPADPLALERVKELHEAGFLGIKLHPYYQEFDLDEERLFPLYEALQAHGLILLCHTGFDFAFPRTRKCDPAKVCTVIRSVPGLKLVAAHLGAWEDWEEVERHLLGKPVYMDLSFSIDWLGPVRTKEFLGRHPAEYVLFGTDSPWAGQQETLDLLRSLELGTEREHAILEGNAEHLLSGRIQNAVLRDCP